MPLGLSSSAFAETARVVIPVALPPERRPLVLDRRSAIDAMRRAKSRDEILVGLLRGAAAWLERPQVYTLRAGMLVGHIAIEGDAIDRERVRARRLALDAPSLLCWAARDGIIRLGPVEADDPGRALCASAALERGWVAAPVRLGRRVACLLIGHPHRGVSRELRDGAAHLASRASDELGRLILQTRVDRRDAEEAIPLTRRKHPCAPAAGQAAIPRRAHSTPPQQPPRYPTCIAVKYDSPHNFFSGFIEDLSDGGLFVATYAPAPIGATLELAFTLPGLEGPCAIEAEVRWVRDYRPGGSSDDLPPGMGLKLLRLPAAAEAAIERFMRRRPPIFYPG